jgi:putative PIG3 family NAD(P)H quinone oxidoreductase
MASIPETMKVVEISKPGGPEVLKPAERPVPKPDDGQILIKVEAAGVNRPDAIQRSGAYPPPPGASDLPGLECAGEVAAIGAGVFKWKVGDKVCALLPGGGYAEYALTHESHALPIPDGLTALEAAALPETCFTVWTNVFDRGRLQAGESLLVHGGSSGIGTTAIQMASAFGARVFVTAGSPEKCRFCEGIGAERAINYKTEDFVEVIKEATDGGVNLILDMVGGDYLPRDVKALATDGRLCMIAFLGGPKAELDFSKVMIKRLTITGSTLRPQSVEAKAAIAANLEEKVWPLISSGQIGPILDSAYPLEDAAAAHVRMESSAHIGKIVLEI